MKRWAQFADEQPGLESVARGLLYQYGLGLRRSLRTDLYKPR
jgi:hypothetical protein